MGEQSICAVTTSLIQWLGLSENLQQTSASQGVYHQVYFRFSRFCPSNCGTWLVVLLLFVLLRLSLLPLFECQPRSETIKHAGRFKQFAGRSPRFWSPNLSDTELALAWSIGLNAWWALAALVSKASSSSKFQFLHLHAAHAICTCIHVHHNWNTHEYPSYM